MKNNVLGSTFGGFAAGLTSGFGGQSGQTCTVSGSSGQSGQSGTTSGFGVQSTSSGNDTADMFATEAASSEKHCGGQKRPSEHSTIFESVTDGIGKFTRDTPKR